MRDYALIVGVLICAVVALRFPVFGFLTYVFFTIANPASMTWGIGHSFPLGMIMAIATIVGFVLWNETKAMPRQREVFMLCGLWIMYGVSTILAIDQEAALPVFSKVSKMLLMIFFSMMLINNQDRLFQFLRVISLSIGVYGLSGGIFAIASGGQHMVYGPEDSFLYANNSVGMAFAMNAPLLYYLTKIEPNVWVRRLMWAMLIMSYPATVCTFSRGAWIGLGVSTLLIVLKTKHRVPIILGGLLLGATLGPVLSQFAPDRVVNRVQDLQNYREEGSAQSRFWTWEFCARVGFALPLHGGGFDYYSEETYRTYFPEYLTHWSTTVHSCHSMWMTILGEHGVFGMAIWCGLLGSVFFSTLELRRCVQARQFNERASYYCNMIQIALISYAVTGIFLDTAYFDLLYMLIAAIVILKEQAFNKNAFAVSKGTTVAEQPSILLAGAR